MTQQRPATFKSATVIFYALFAGQVMMGVVLYFLKSEGELPEDVGSPYNFLIPGLVIIGAAGAYMFRQFFSNIIPVNGSIQEKLNHYQRSSIITYAMAEAGNLISLVLAFLYGNLNSFIWFVLGLGFFMLFRPDRARFVDEYQVKGEFE